MHGKSAARGVMFQIDSLGVALFYSFYKYVKRETVRKSTHQNVVTGTNGITRASTLRGGIEVGAANTCIMIFRYVCVASDALL
jgi:hypothetical protein